MIESRRRQLIEMVRVRRDEKRKVLRDQLEAIQDEKKSLEKVSSSLTYLLPYPSSSLNLPFRSWSRVQSPFEMWLVVQRRSVQMDDYLIQRRMHSFD